MKKSLNQSITIIPFVFLLCFAFNCRQDVKVAPSSLEIIKIAFHSTRSRNSEIYVMNADGSEQKRLTKNLVRDLAPSWSPDGKKIVFVSDRDGNLEIYVMNSDGSEQKRLTNNQAWDDYPSWSPFLKTGK